MNPSIQTSLYGLKWIHLVFVRLFLYHIVWIRLEKNKKDFFLPYSRFKPTQSQVSIWIEIKPNMSLPCDV